MGQLVVVTTDVRTDDAESMLLRVGTVGRITAIDDDGDAAINFARINGIAYEKPLFLAGVLYVPALHYVEPEAGQNVVSEKWIYDNKFHHLVPLPEAHTNAQQDNAYCYQAPSALPRNNR